MKICRLCKHPNPDENNYCEKCNLSFKDGAVRKSYYNEKEDPLTYIKKNVQGRGKVAKSSNISNYLSGVLRIVGILIILCVIIGSYLYVNKDVNTYNEAVELWNNNEIKAAVEVAKEISGNSKRYNEAQILIKNGEDYLLYSKAVDLWNSGNYEEAVKIFNSFTEESEYYIHAQKVLKDM